MINWLETIRNTHFLFQTAAYSHEALQSYTLSTFCPKNPTVLLMGLLHYKPNFNKVFFTYFLLQTAAYAHHLDWHYRQTRKKQKGSSNSKPIMSLEDWVQYEEIEDADEHGDYY